MGHTRLPGQVLLGQVEMSEDHASASKTVTSMKWSLRFSIGWEDLAGNRELWRNYLE